MFFPSTELISCIWKRYGSTYRPGQNFFEIIIRKHVHRRLRRNVCSVGMREYRQELERSVPSRRSISPTTGDRERSCSDRYLNIFGTNSVERELPLPEPIQSSAFQRSFHIPYVLKILQSLQIYVLDTQVYRRIRSVLSRVTLC